MAVVVAVPVSAEKKSAKVEKVFVALFDGTTTDQWMNARSGKFPGKGWAIEGDCLKHAAKGANSGVKYFIIRERGSLGHEYQVIDDINHPDGVRGNHQTASFYDVLAPAKDKPLKPVGEFNTSRILVKGQTVKHFLNGKVVLTYELGSDEVKAAVAKSKFRKLEKFGVRLAGHILLQDHGDEVWYRNIRIRDLSKK